jgi:hypothetical protein
MSSTTLYRLSGWSLLVGAVIFALGNLIHPLEHSQEAYLVSTWVEAHVLIIIGSFMLALGLPALYLRQGEKKGVLGFIGLILTLIGLAGAISGSWYEAFVAPVINPLDAAEIENGFGGLFNAITGLAFVCGPAVFGIAGLRAKLFPWPPVVLFIVVMVILLVLPALPFPEGIWIIPATVLDAAAFAWLGYPLLKNPSATKVQRQQAAIA